MTTGLPYTSPQQRCDVRPSGAGLAHDAEEALAVFPIYQPSEVLLDSSRLR